MADYQKNNLRKKVLYFGVPLMLLATMGANSLFGIDNPLSRNYSNSDKPNIIFKDSHKHRAPHDESNRLNDEKRYFRDEKSAIEAYLKLAGLLSLR